MKEQVLKILRSVRKDVDFEQATALIDDNVLDSFDIISILSNLNETFGIDITADELEPENFNTLDAIRRAGEVPAVTYLVCTGIAA